MLADLQACAAVAMLRELMLKRCVATVVWSPRARKLRQRLVLGALFVLTLMVLVVRLELELDASFVEANTLVLQGGFPAILVNSSSLVSSQSLRSSSLSFGGTMDFKMAALVEKQKRKWLATSYKPRLGRHEREPRCSKLIVDDEKEQARARKFMEEHERLEKPPLVYLQETKNCSRFVQERGYIMSATEEEKAFPIAYSIMMYTGVEQTERMLRAIYRPHNYHCIHVDKKVPEDIMAAMQAIAECLPNVFIASRLKEVYWATYSSLEALIYCMQDLFKASASWKYYINLTGQEFPLKTNLQLVKILEALNGSNIVDASTDPDMTSRWYNNFQPPHAIMPYKGMVFIIACRGFVDYLLHSHVARDFLQWVSNTEMPDETYFPSLNHNPHLRVPGSYRGSPDTNALTKPYLARFVNWNTNWKDGVGRYNFRFPCHGKRVRSVCIFGLGDLRWLTSRKELFANKFYADFEPLTLRCMEEWLLNMTVAEYSGRLLLNVSYYASLDIVRNKVV